MNKTFLSFSTCNALFSWLWPTWNAAVASRGDGSQPRQPPRAAEDRTRGKPRYFKVIILNSFNCATAAMPRAELNVTGAVNPDVSKEVPVISLASGRVVEIHARLGDSVTKGQLLHAHSEFRYLAGFLRLPPGGLTKLARDAIRPGETPVRQRRHRAKRSGSGRKRGYQGQGHGENTREHLRVLGADTNKRVADRYLFAPVSGVITEQNVTNAAGVNPPTTHRTCLPSRTSRTSGSFATFFENDMPYCADR